MDGHCLNNICLFDEISRAKAIESTITRSYILYFLNACNDHVCDERMGVFGA